MKEYHIWYLPIDKEIIVRAESHLMTIIEGGMTAAYGLGKEYPVLKLFANGAEVAVFTTYDYFTVEPVAPTAGEAVEEAERHLRK